VATTGMTSREVFEVRERSKAGHRRDFLCVGSMGHCSQIALGLAQHRPSRQVFCFDGDGSVLMHMGSLAVIGAQRPSNLKHVVLHNGVHDSVGGQPTAGSHTDLCAVASACGYLSAERAITADEITAAMRRARDLVGPLMVEIRVRRGARSDLGRPTMAPLESKAAFMEALGNEPR
jgi:phosphonopyruvate decarboxylase